MNRGDKGEPEEQRQGDVQDGGPGAHRSRHDGDVQQDRSARESDANPSVREGPRQFRLQGRGEKRRIEREHQAVAQRVDGELPTKPRRIEAVPMNRGRQHQIDVAAGDEGRALDDEQERELARHAARCSDTVQHDRQSPAHRNRGECQESDRADLKHAPILAKRPARSVEIRVRPGSGPVPCISKPIG